MAGISMQHVAKVYDDKYPVIRDVTLDIADGEFCVFIGPSGCGKSTLLRMIAGLEDITSGDLYMGGRRVNALAPSERDIAMVFQNYALYPHMDVASNIGFGLSLLGIDKDAVATRVRNIADTLQITHLLQRKPKDLSGGQRQRVAIGRALVRNPGVFLFDEPLSNLDASLRTQTRMEIAKLHREFSRACSVYVTHDQVEAMTLADKIVLLYPGSENHTSSVAQLGAPLELYANPRNLFVAGFLGSPTMNFLPASVQSLGAHGLLLTTEEGRSIQTRAVSDQVAPGTPVTLGIRPEHLFLACEGEANTLRYRTEWIEQLGDITYAYLRNAASKIVIRLHAGTSLDLDELVFVKLDAAACHVFDVDGTALGRITL